MIKLKIKDRDKRVRELRKEGLVPAVIYGPEIENKNVMIDSRQFYKVLKEAGESSMIELKGGKESFKVLIKDYQLDPVTDEFLHADFYQPILTEKVEASVPLRFVGESPAVKEEGGVLVRNLSEVTVSALPEKLPSEIKVNIESLEDLHDHVTVEDLDVPEGVKILRGGDEIVATVSAPKTAEELEEELERAEEEELFVGEEVPVEELEEGMELEEGEEVEEVEEEGVEEEGAEEEQEGIEL